MGSSLSFEKKEEVKEVKSYCRQIIWYRFYGQTNAAKAHVNKYSSFIYYTRSAK